MTTPEKYHVRGLGRRSERNNSGGTTNKVLKFAETFGRN
jgi:hypothetical protein